MATILDKIREKKNAGSSYYVFLGNRDTAGDIAKSVAKQILKGLSPANDGINEKVSKGELPLNGVNEIFRKGSLLNTDNGKVYTYGNYAVWDHNIWEANRPVVGVYALVDKDTMQRNIINLNKRENVFYDKMHVSPEVSALIKGMFSSGLLHNDHHQSDKAILKAELQEYGPDSVYNITDSAAADYQRGSDGERIYFVLSRALNSPALNEEISLGIENGNKADAIAKALKDTAGAGRAHPDIADLAVIDPLALVASGGIEYRDDNVLVVRDDATNSLNVWNKHTKEEILNSMQERIEQDPDFQYLADSSYTFSFPEVAEMDPSYWKEEGVSAAALHVYEQEAAAPRDRRIARLDGIAKALGEGFTWEAEAGEKVVVPDDYYFNGNEQAPITAPIGIRVDLDNNKPTAAIVRMNVENGKLSMDVYSGGNVERGYDAVENLEDYDIDNLSRFATNKLAERFSVENKDKYFILLDTSFKGDINNMEEVNPDGDSLLSATKGKIPGDLPVISALNERYAVVNNRYLYASMTEKELSEAIAGTPNLVEDSKFMHVSKDVRPIVNNLVKQGRYTELLGDMFQAEDLEKVSKIAEEGVSLSDRKAAGLHGVIHGDGYIGVDSTMSARLADTDGRYHQKDANMQRAYKRLASIIKLWNDYHYPMSRQYMTSVPGDHGAALATSIWSHLNGFKHNDYLMASQLDYAGVEVDPRAKELRLPDITSPLGYTDWYNVEQTINFSQDLKDPEVTKHFEELGLQSLADTGVDKESSLERRNALKDLAEKSLWRVPVTVVDKFDDSHSAHKTFAYYDIKDDTVYIKGHDGKVGEMGDEEIRDLTGALADSILTSGRVRNDGGPMLEDARRLIGQMTMVEYGLKDNTVKGPLLTEETSKRIADGDIAYFRRLWETSSAVSTAISQRSAGLADDLDEVLDDDDYQKVDDDQSNNIDLRASNPNGLDVDGNGIPEEEETLEASRKNENIPEMHSEQHQGHSHGRSI